MRNIRYVLTPEAYGSNGEFIDKIGTLGDLVVDTGMLLRPQFDKTIPNIKVLNSLFREGWYPRSAEWEPFEIDSDEYNELVEYLLSLPLNKPYKLE
ncbi:hypothetical protein [Clostridium perfringens]|uniref:Uncharacterized protein n=2 Tax=Clostridium perfringens TaxID=1502 RepID=Q0SPM9_CLOPS|nr:hypothetical protein [Clostridium perfringens]ABG87871.1 hypothetical protein CPR_A0007 [Clostridium perfringens SM101]EJT6157510.1 hypothetical protein [Clostridium perfringens]UBK59502.1 hypothetical protein KLF43_13800 [Clostridium perfringens]UBK67497.1 hypothetical protein KLF46_13770 [Clostridium perfringens]UBL09439.1 hypothetical protein KLF39_14265 [Clostridium perfringens]